MLGVDGKAAKQKEEMQSTENSYFHKIFSIKWEMINVDVFNRHQVV